MGKVTYAPGIDYVQGSLAKPKKKDGHKCGEYLIGTHREAPTQNPECTRLYIRKADAYERTTPPTQRELAARTRFAAVKAAVWTRAHDLSKVTADQEAFLAQKDTAGGKTTLQAYYWKICGDAYDEALANG